MEAELKSQVRVFRALEQDLGRSALQNHGTKKVRTKRILLIQKSLNAVKLCSKKNTQSGMFCWKTKNKNKTSIKLGNLRSRLEPRRCSPSAVGVC